MALMYKGSMFPKMRVDHARIGGVVSEQIMRNELLATPVVIGVGHGRPLDDFKLAVHRHHDGSQCRGAVGLVWCQFGPRACGGFLIPTLDKSHAEERNQGQDMCVFHLRVGLRS